MEGDSCSSSLSASLSSAYKCFHNHTSLHSRSDMLMGFDENDGDDNIREEFLCPFCSEYFDIVGLCYHIDEEHPVEAKKWVCPVCTLRVGIDLVAHITLQHGNMLKMQLKRKSRKGGSYSTVNTIIIEEDAARRKFAIPFWWFLMYKVLI